MQSNENTYQEKKENYYEEYVHNQFIFHTWFSNHLFNYFILGYSISSFEPIYINNLWTNSIYPFHNNNLSSAMRLFATSSSQFISFMPRNNSKIKEQI